MNLSNPSRTLPDAGLTLQTPEPGRWARLVAARWALVPVALLVSLTSGLAVMIRIAVHDPGFAVAPEYYQHALKWDEERERQRQSSQLGWSGTWDFSNGEAHAPGPAQVRPLGLSLRDALGAPLAGARVTVSAFHNARAAEVQKLLFTERTPGEYVAQLQFRAAGIWHLDVEVDARGQHFAQSSDVELGGAGGRVLQPRAVHVTPKAVRSTPAAISETP
jgi:nitrogen fixation protein FixH